MTEQEFNQLIEMTPFRGREPIFRGTTITVKHILDDLEKGMSADEILLNHKELTEQHIKAISVFLEIQRENQFLLGQLAVGRFPWWRLFNGDKRKYFD